MAWVRVLFTALVLPTLLSACYASHPRGGGRDAGPSDGSPPRLDVPSPPDVPRPPDVPAPRDAGSCTSGRGVRVRVEPITMDRSRCDPGRYEGVVVYAIEPAPLDDGVRIRTDLCPLADADCRCDYVLENVGADLAAGALVPREATNVDWSERYFSITQVPHCECSGCPCSLALVLEAADSLLDSPSPFPADELDVREGPVVCDPVGCEPGGWLLRASSQGVESDVPEGTEVQLGVVHVRSVRNVDVFGPCAACATCGSLQASWVAWVSAGT